VRTFAFATNGHAKKFDSQLGQNLSQGGAVTARAVDLG
jgi:hypothetical protein